MRERTSARGSAGAERVHKVLPIAAAGALLLSSLILTRTAYAATCTYDDVSREVSVQIGPGETAALAVDGGGVGFDDVDTAGSILFRQGDERYEFCDGARNDLASRIVVSGQETSSETFTIDERTGAAFATTIAWSVDLRSGEADTFAITAGDANNDIAFAGESFTLNGGGGGLPGVERVEVSGSVGDDRIDASGRSNATRLTGGDGFDVLIGGTANDVLLGDDDDDRLIGGDGDDVLDGGPNVDTLYGGGGADTCILDERPLGCDPSISIEPESVDPGGQLRVTGAGWYPENGPVGFAFGPSDDASLPALEPDPTGSIEGNATAPSAEATYSIVACQPCIDGDADRAPETLVVLAAGGTTTTVEPSDRTLELDPSEGSPGEVVTVLGEGWDRADGKVRIFVDPSNSEADPVVFPRPLADSTFEGRLEIPDLGEGSYTVLACQHCNRGSRVEQTTTLTVASAAPGWPAWLWILVGVVVVAAIAAAVIGGIRMREVRLRRRIGTRPHFADPQVQPVTEEPNGSLRHRVELIPHEDVGVQHVSEGSPHE